MNKKKIVIYILVLFSIILIINGVKTNADTATGQFALANLPPVDPVTFRVKDYDDGSGCLTENECFDFYDLESQDEDPSNDDNDGDTYADTHMIYDDVAPALEIRWEIGEDPNFDPVYPLICISSTSANRIAAKAAYDPTTVLATDAEYCDVLNLWTGSLVTPLAPNTVASYIFDGSEDQFNHSIDESSPNKEYYITIVNYDNALSSSFYDVEVWVKNQAPTQVAGFVTEDIDNTHPSFNTWFPGGENPWVPLNNHEADTHIQEPDLNWDDATDPDDGSAKDIYPGDPVVYYIYVGEDAGSFGTLDATNIKYDLVFLPSSIFTNAWDQYLEWGDTPNIPVVGQVRSNYYYTINSTDGWLEAITTGNFDLVDNLPTIWSIGMWNDGMDQGTEECPYTESPGSTCTLLGTEHDYTQDILLNLTLYDADMDFRVDASEYGSDPATCPGDVCFDGMIYICLETGPLCDELNYDYGPFSLQQLNPDPNSAFSDYAYLTRVGITEDDIDIDGSAGTPTPEFYKPYSYGTYLVHASVTSHSTVEDDADPDVDSIWDWESFRAPNYEEDVSGFVYIGDGNIELWDTWNPGTDGGESFDGTYDMINWGNTVLDLEWGSGDYYHTDNSLQVLDCASTAEGLCSAIPGALCGWDIDEVASGLLIDDDNDCDSAYPDGGSAGCGEAVETGLSQVKIPSIASYAQFVYAGGLTLCSDFSCDAGNERLPTHWHVSPITGLCADAPGTYQGLIEWVDSEF